LKYFIGQKAGWREATDDLTVQPRTLKSAYPHLLRKQPLFVRVAFGDRKKA